MYIFVFFSPDCYGKCCTDAIPKCRQFAPLQALKWASFRKTVLKESSEFVVVTMLQNVVHAVIFNLGI